MNKKPNILLILTDQQSLRTLSCYGESPCIAPNIEKLRREGVLFRNAYTTCPLCSPARATVMTGLYPLKHGVTNNVHNIGCSISELPDCDMMLSRKLIAGGYRCGYTGKWHLGTDNDREYIYDNAASLPKDLGFKGQNFPGHGDGGFRFPEYEAYLKKNGFKHGVKKVNGMGKARVPRFGVLEEPGEEATVPYFLAEHTISLIDEFGGKDKPFFIWHNFWGPHEPYYVPEKYLSMYDDADIPEWPNYRWDSDGNDGSHLGCINPSRDELRWPDWERAIKHYYAFTTLIDEQIGRIMGHLRQKDLLDDTLIIFTADHGETLGSHGGLMDKGLFHFEEIQRIPFIMKLPGGECAGGEYEELISLADVYPTILDYAQIGWDKEKAQGLSIKELVAAGSGNWREEIVVESEGCQNVSISLRTLRFGRWKYCFTFSHEEMLFDLEADPFEMNNLAGDEASHKVLNDMRERLERWMIENGDMFRPAGFLPYVLRRGYKSIKQHSAVYQSNNKYIRKEK